MEFTEADTLVLTNIADNRYDALSPALRRRDGRSVHLQHRGGEICVRRVTVE